MKIRCSRTAVATWLAVLLTAPAGAFDPADYGTVSLHLMAGSLEQANNTAVQEWGPLTAAGISRPTFIASDSRFNNQPVVRFDGSNDLMTFTAADLTAWTIFAVVTGEAGSPSLATLISNGNDGLDLRRNGTSAAYRSPGVSQDNNDFTGNGSPTGSLSVNNTGTAAFTNAVPHLVNAIAGGPKNYSTLWLGNASSSLSRFWRGSVAEILIFENALSAPAINGVGFYLQEKYNLPTNFTTPDPVIPVFTATTAGGVSSQGGVLSTPGTAVTLTWSVAQAATVSIAPGVLETGATFTGSAVVSPTVTTTYTLTAANSGGSQSTRTVTIQIGETPLPPLINEFVADNESGLTGDAGSFPDWIEIYNPNPYGIDLHGLQLRDSNAQWDFPPGSGIPAMGYRLVMATGENRQDPAGTLHTNFSLNNNGEALSLVRSGTGEILTEFTPLFPEQYPDISYGWFGDPPRLGYFGGSTGNPTPGMANTAGVLGFLDRTDDTRFTVGRGFYTEAVTTTVSAATPGATLVYTLNGSEPSLTNGIIVPPANPQTPPSVTLTIHPGPVPADSPDDHVPTIGGVTTLRAAAFLEGYAPTNIDTQTYLFSSGILSQTPANAIAKGWPSSSVNGQLFNFGMDPAVVSSFPGTEMQESLYALPALSIVTAQGNLTASANGIYVNADQHGAAWERPISLELIHPPGYVSPDGNPGGFQIDAGLRIRGGYSRGDQFFKHGLRFYFSKKYDGKLRYPLFGREGTDEFGKLDLGTGSNYAWYRESSYSNGRFNTMVRDPFCRDTQGALGQPYTKSRYYHIYLNGHYWGLYYTEERAEAEFAASYFGGDADEYDAVKCGNHIGNFQTEATDGTLDAWRALWTKTRALATTGATLAKYFEIEGRNPDGTRNPEIPVLLDIDNLIDEMLVIFYAGDGDAVLSNFLGHDRPNNWFSIYRRTGTDGFRFFVRDAEHTLGAPAWVVDQTGPWGGTYVNNFTYSNPQRMHQDLMSSPEYKLRFADHVRRHFFDGGALTPAASLARWQARADQLAKAIKAESARWGDAQRITGLPANHPPRYIVADWEAAINLVKNNILPNRTNIVLNQLRNDGLYPAIAAPEFLTTTGEPHYGGNFPGGTTVRIGAPAGTIHYTLDGQDPRLPGGAISPAALTSPGPIDLPLTTSTTVKSRAYNPENSTWSALTESRFWIGNLASSANLTITQIHYHPAEGQEEFLELMNIAGTPVDLTGCRFSAGISFQFPDNFILAPGSRTLVVRDAAAFQTAYPDVPPALIAGAFANDTALSNSGEAIELLAADGSIIFSFTWDDDFPWPPSPDGSGTALVLIAPSTKPSAADPLQWRSSTTIARPGVSDAYTYATWAAANGIPVSDGTGDTDGDALPDLIEYSLGTSATSPNPPPFRPVLQEIFAEGVTKDWLTVTLQHPVGHDDARLMVEASNDLGSGWVPAIPQGPPFHQLDGKISQLYRHPEPVGNSRQFLRLKAVRIP